MKPTEQADRKILGLIGLAARARRVCVGVPLCCTAMAKGGAAAPLAVVIAADAAQNSAKRIKDRCAFYGVPAVNTRADTLALAAAVGKRDAAVAAVGITEPHLAKEIVAAAAADEV